MKKLVVHLSDGREESAAEALRMIGHFSGMDSSAETSAVLVVTGAAVRLFQKGSPLTEEILRVARTPPVKIKLCRNALKRNGIVESSIFPEIELVPSGVCELVSLEQGGYAYVKAG